MKFIKDYFNFNKRQERGVLVLSIIFLVSLSINHFGPKYLTKAPAHLSHNTPFLNQLNTVKFEAEKEKSKYNPKSSNFKNPPEKIALVNLSFFDPNQVSSAQLLKMGLSEYVVRNVMKYRDKGGFFKSKNDLSKIYGMEESVFKQLEPYIRIELPEPKKEKELEIKKLDKLVIAKPLMKAPLVDINTADSIQLIEVTGIGPFYAGAIVEYRNRLGGYLRMEQLKELYKMDDEKYAKMILGLKLDTIIIKQIPLNTAEFKSILRHPYIDYETTKYIVNMRKQLGKFSALYQLKDSNCFPDSLYLKLEPYLYLD
ncbi:MULTISPECIES: helix-hairpin-helix domain-containing protein [unclassified Lentimicrobium]|uniref:helix-hairpin-helix domain-containing protein n=1 Tax=unclassified Lentimicrobium TaxID=2677434 RepID=UPI00155321FC|nr:MULTISPECIES: helix-hairpin-helix domain-containing protein [unclassified Lentimicrobium]NPD45774.1 hypothetical protein [Lentimicrobium sp. S6]NPD84789.1 hypothetical protein [Lentimicrobium sp. L6]